MSKAKGDEGRPIPIILSAQSLNGNYLGSDVTIALTLCIIFFC